MFCLIVESHFFSRTEMKPITRKSQGHLAIYCEYAREKRLMTPSTALEALCEGIAFNTPKKIVY